MPPGLRSGGATERRLLDRASWRGAGLRRHSPNRGSTATYPAEQGGQLGELVDLTPAGRAPVEVRGIVGSLRRGQGAQQVDTAVGETGTARRVELTAGSGHDATPSAGRPARWRVGPSSAAPASWRRSARSA
jgi:hypothetical protein